MRKIMGICPHFDMEPLFEWDLKVMSVVFDWLNRARAFTEINEDIINDSMLASVYQFVRFMPLMFVQCKQNPPTYSRYI